MGGLVGCPLGKLGAVLRVLKKVLRLFHGVLRSGRWGANAWIQLEPELSFVQADDHRFSFKQDGGLRYANPPG
jgi:hypothetical protein